MTRQERIDAVFKRALAAQRQVAFDRAIAEGRIRRKEVMRGDWKYMGHYQEADQFQHCDTHLYARLANLAKTGATPPPKETA